MVRFSPRHRFITRECSVITTIGNMSRNIGSQSDAARGEFNNSVNAGTVDGLSEYLILKSRIILDNVPVFFFRTSHQTVNVGKESLRLVEVHGAKYASSRCFEKYRQLGLSVSARIAKCDDTVREMCRSHYVGKKTSGNQRDERAKQYFKALVPRHHSSLL